MIQHVIDRVRDWLDRGVPDAEIAVLAYKNSMVAKLARGLRSKAIAAHEVGLPALSSTQAFSVLQRAVASDQDGDPDESTLDVVDRLHATSLVEEALAGANEKEAEQNADDWERLRAAVDERRRAGAIDVVDALQAIRRGEEGPATRIGVTVTTMTPGQGARMGSGGRH